MRLLLTLLLIGCGSAQRPAVSYQPGFDQAQMAASVQRHVQAFEQAYGPVRFQLTVVPGERLSNGYVGWTEGNNITLAAGDLSGRWLTHELHHVVHDPGNNHADPRWPAWDLEDLQLSGGSR